MKYQLTSKNDDRGSVKPPSNHGRVRSTCLRFNYSKMNYWICSTQNAHHVKRGFFWGGRRFSSHKSRCTCPKTKLYLTEKHFATLRTQIMHATGNKTIPSLQVFIGTTIYPFVLSLQVFGSRNMNFHSVILSRRPKDRTNLDSDCSIWP